MITTKFFDGGTELKIHAAESVAGMDKPVWIQQDFEEDLFQSRKHLIDNLFREVNPLTIRPWPEKMPGKMWVDNFATYSDPNDGLRFNLYHYDQVHGDYPAMPAGNCNFITDPDEYDDVANSRLDRALSWEEVQTRAETPTEWLRMWSKNEHGGTRLGEPLVLRMRGNRGKSVVLALPDNSLFAPFDLRYPERYRVFPDEIGAEVLGEDEARSYLRLHNNGVYRLYLRPRRWRWFADVIARYFYASMWQSAIYEERFVVAWYDRPPVYPYRHSVLTGFEEDAGCFWQFEHSRAAAYLRKQILDAQWWTICETYIFAGNDPAKITIWRDPQRSGDFVLGIGRVDTSTGKESRVWVQQISELSTEYPRTQIAYFPQAPFNALGV